MKLVQMNTRLGAEVKRAGDQVLYRYGYTPSSAVQALWAYLAECNSLPEFMPSRAASTEKEERIQAVADDVGIAFRLYNELTGASLNYDDASLHTDEELRIEEWVERGAFDV